MLTHDPVLAQLALEVELLRRERDALRRILDARTRQLTRRLSQNGHAATNDLTTQPPVAPPPTNGHTSVSLPGAELATARAEIARLRTTLRQCETLARQFLTNRRYTVVLGQIAALAADGHRGQSAVTVAPDLAEPGGE